MRKKKIGIVSEEEKNEIKTLFERRLGLNELMSVLSSNVILKDEKESLYNKLVLDTGETKMCFDNWWKEMSKKYKWKACDNKRWEIDFNTNEVFLVSEAGGKNILCQKKSANETFIADI